jgi:acyl-CoA thioesterase FadM
MMARLKIFLPEKLLSTVFIPIRITDINYGNHLGNNSIVEIIHEARVMFLKQNNFTELNIGGPGLIMSELQVEFKNESFYGDSLKVEVFAGEISRTGFEIFYSLIVERNGNNLVVANAKTTMACFDYQQKKVTSLPLEFKKILERD